MASSGKPLRITGTRSVHHQFMFRAKHGDGRACGRGFVPRFTEQRLDAQADAMNVYFKNMPLCQDRFFECSKAWALSNGRF
ncbi:MAG: hypothetical protein ACTS5I_07840 [Rhodanobacter sp.]